MAREATRRLRAYEVNDPDASEDSVSDRHGLFFELESSLIDVPAASRISLDDLTTSIQGMRSSLATVGAELNAMEADGFLLIDSSSSGAGRQFLSDLTQRIQTLETVFTSTLEAVCSLVLLALLYFL